jgi:hypothetical protein
MSGIKFEQYSSKWFFSSFNRTARLRRGLSCECEEQHLHESCLTLMVWRFEVTLLNFFLTSSMLHIFQLVNSYNTYQGDCCIVIAESKSFNE